MSVLSLSRAHKLAVGKYPCSLLNYFTRVLYTASHFANVYHWVINMYPLIDQEAEMSIKYFASQLFTVPTVAAYIIHNHKLISRLLAIITTFFTNKIAEKHIVYPSISNAAVNVDSFPFKSKWFMLVFSDLRYLCHNEPVQQLIAQLRIHSPICEDMPTVHMCKSKQTCGDEPCRILDRCLD
jgi:E3 ubiquitin-protein ligase UBR1